MALTKLVAYDHDGRRIVIYPRTQENPLGPGYCCQHLVEGFGWCVAEEDDMSDSEAESLLAEAANAADEAVKRAISARD